MRSFVPPTFIVGFTQPQLQIHRECSTLSPFIMSDNPSFVLRGIEDVVYEVRSIPDGSSIAYEVANLW